MNVVYVRVHIRVFRVIAEGQRVEVKNCFRIKIDLITHAPKRSLFSKYHFVGNFPYIRNKLKIESYFKA